MGSPPLLFLSGAAFTLMGNALQDTVGNTNRLGRASCLRFIVIHSSIGVLADPRPWVRKAEIGAASFMLGGVTMMEGLGKGFHTLSVLGFLAFIAYYFYFRKR